MENMNKKLIRLTESDLHRIVKNATIKAINEMNDFVYDLNDYRDIGTTSGIKNFGQIQTIYNDLGKIINAGKTKPKWQFLHEYDWTKLIGKIKTTIERMRFETLNNGNNVANEDKEYIDNFSKEVSKMPYPDLWTSSNSSFVDKANSVMKSLMTAYRLLGDFIDYFLDKHETGEMKQNDIEADWKKFDKTRNDMDKTYRANAESARNMRDLNDYQFSHDLRKNALRRYNNSITGD